MEFYSMDNVCIPEIPKVFLYKLFMEGREEQL